MRANDSHIQLRIRDNAPIDISVVMPLFNKGGEVIKAIRSVLGQTFDNYELIVVNDGSTDDGPAVVRCFTDPRIRLIEQRNMGVSAARNRGIEESKSDLVAFLDADDEWLPDFLETINRLRTLFSSCSVFATNYLYRNIDGSFMPTIIRGLPTAPWEGVFENYFKVASKSDPPIWSSAVAIKKEAIKSIGGFPAGVTAGEDLLTWAKLASRHKIAYSSQPAVLFCLRESLWGPPTRFPDLVDIVGQEFEKILNNGANAKISGLEEYIAHWHQMRASVYLRLGKHKEAIYEVSKMARYSRKSLKLYVFLILALMPKKICDRFFKSINSLRYIDRYSYR
jgi:glycosyltransferase involved in cell wall biosynthesis